MYVAENTFGQSTKLVELLVKAKAGISLTDSVSANDDCMVNLCTFVYGWLSNKV